MPRLLTLNISDDLYESMVRIAARTRQTPEELAACWFAEGARGFDEDPLLNLAGSLDFEPLDPAVESYEPVATTAEGARVARDG